MPDPFAEIDARREAALQAADAENLAKLQEHNDYLIKTGKPPISNLQVEKQFKKPLGAMGQSDWDSLKPARSMGQNAADLGMAAARGVANVGGGIGVMGENIADLVTGNFDRKPAAYKAFSRQMAENADNEKILSSGPGAPVEFKIGDQRVVSNPDVLPMPYEKPKGGFQNFAEGVAEMAPVLGASAVSPSVGASTVFAQSVGAGEQQRAIDPSIDPMTPYAKGVFNAATFAIPGMTLAKAGQGAAAPVATGAGKSALVYEGANINRAMMAGAINAGANNAVIGAGQAVGDRLLDKALGNEVPDMTAGSLAEGVLPWIGVGLLHGGMSGRRSAVAGNAKLTEQQVPVLDQANALRTQARAEDQAATDARQRIAESAMRKEEITRQAAAQEGERALAEQNASAEMARQQAAAIETQAAEQLAVRKAQARASQEAAQARLDEITPSIEAEQQALRNAAMQVRDARQTGEVPPPYPETPASDAAKKTLKDFENNRLLEQNLAVTKATQAKIAEAKSLADAEAAKLKPLQETPVELRSPELAKLVEKTTESSNTARAVYEKVAAENTRIQAAEDARRSGEDLTTARGQFEAAKRLNTPIERIEDAIPTPSADQTPNGQGTVIQGRQQAELATQDRNVGVQGQKDAKAITNESVQKTTGVPSDANAVGGRAPSGESRRRGNLSEGYGPGDIVADIKNPKKRYKVTGVTEDGMLEVRNQSVGPQPETGREIIHPEKVFRESPAVPVDETHMNRLLKQEGVNYEVKDGHLHVAGDSIPLGKILFQDALFDPGAKVTKGERHVGLHDPETGSSQILTGRTPEEMAKTVVHEVSHHMFERKVTPEERTIVKDEMAARTGITEPSKTELHEFFADEVERSLKTAYSRGLQKAPSAFGRVVAKITNAVRRALGWPQKETGHVAEISKLGRILSDFRLENSANALTPFRSQMGRRPMPRPKKRSARHPGAIGSWPYSSREHERPSILRERARRDRTPRSPRAAVRGGRAGEQGSVAECPFGQGEFSQAGGQLCGAPGFPAPAHDKSGVRPEAQSSRSASRCASSAHITRPRAG